MVGVSVVITITQFEKPWPRTYRRAGAILKWMLIVNFFMPYMER
jgi:hypothetical protein